MNHAIRLFLGLILGAVALPAQERPLRVVSLHTVLTEIAREVGGDQVAVTGLVRPGVDPHEFDPSAADVRLVADADLVLAGGLHLESYLDRLATEAGVSGRVCLVGDALPHVLTPAGGGTPPPLSAGAEQDPHWWHSIDNVRFATDLVRARLTALRPASADAFARHARAYEQRLADLKAWVAREVARVPPARRQLVTSHDALGYFARDYGFTIHPISGLSTESEPDARRLGRLIDLIRTEHIPAIFTESGVNPRLIETLVRETGARLGDELYADGLGPVGSDSATYEGMYRHNVRAIVSQLGRP
ncbi:MAG: metal ABC transporter solute-binding protein, Zn/Mn family [Opitutales bacterium]